MARVRNKFILIGGSKINGRKTPQEVINQATRIGAYAKTKALNSRSMSKSIAYVKRSKKASGIAISMAKLSDKNSPFFPDRNKPLNSSAKAKVRG